MKTKNERFTDIRLSLKPMSQTRFSEILGVSLSTVQKIEQGTGEVTDYVQQQLESKCNVNLVYINTGKGVKFINNVVPSFKEVKPVANDLVSSWKDEAYQAIKDERNRLIENVNFLQDIIRANGLNFLSPVKETA